MYFDPAMLPPKRMLIRPGCIHGGGHLAAGSDGPGRRGTDLDAPGQMHYVRDCWGWSAVSRCGFGGTG